MKRKSEYRRGKIFPDVKGENRPQVNRESLKIIITKGDGGTWQSGSREAIWPD